MVPTLPVARSSRGPSPRPAYDADSLLSVAVQVFLRKGYDGTSMADLAVAAGLSKSSIYHHFRGKEEILSRALHVALDSLFAILDEAPARSGPARGRLEWVVTRTVAVLLDRLPYVALLLRVRGNTPTERWALGRRREFDHRVAALVEEAVAAGQVREAVDPRLAARLVLGMVNSISEWYREGGSLSPDTVASAAASIALHGLVSDRSWSERANS